jgi:DNA mismatch endonuclease (patch repair protein)
MEKRLKKHLKDGKFDNVSIKRAKNMSSIHGKNNLSTEICLKMAFVRSGLKGWKLHSKELPGTPDFYFQQAKLAIFVDGCFWHGCPKCGHIPKTRPEFWEAKINRTKQRDREKRTKLRGLGISSLSIWEHDLKEKSGVDKVTKKIEGKIKKLLHPSDAK